MFLKTGGFSWSLHITLKCVLSRFPSFRIAQCYSSVEYLLPFVWLSLLPHTFGQCWRRGAWTYRMDGINRWEGTGVSQSRTGIGTETTPIALRSYSTLVASSFLQVNIKISNFIIFIVNYQCIFYYSEI